MHDTAHPHHAQSGSTQACGSDSAQRLLLTIVAHAMVPAAEAKLLWVKLVEDTASVVPATFEEVLCGLCAHGLLSCIRTVA